MDSQWDSAGASPLGGTAAGHYGGDGLCGHFRPWHMGRTGDKPRLIKPMRYDYKCNCEEAMAGAIGYM